VGGGSGQDQKGDDRLPEERHAGGV
jgi:hypothetical protein